MESLGPCEGCKQGDPADHPAIGQPVCLATARGQGYLTSGLTFSQCSRCGSVWARITERGPGREDSFRLCLTRGLI